MGDRARRRPIVIGVSGPDGAGKTSVAAALVERARSGGRPAVPVYLYGCVACRRVGDRTPSDAPGQGRRSAIDALHAFVDVSELALRLSLAIARARARGAVVVTDRGPLDGVVKHRPRPGSVVDRSYRALLARYALVAVLDADAQVLARRDAEHAMSELGAARERFLAFASRVPNVRVVDSASRPPAAIADEIWGMHPGSR